MIPFTISLNHADSIVGKEQTATVIAHAMLAVSMYRICRLQYCFNPSFSYSSTYFTAQQQACIQIAATIYTQACPRTSLFCFLLYQLSLWWVKYRAQPEAINL